jgi:hypothetical protein
VPPPFVEVLVMGNFPELCQKRTQPHDVLKAEIATVSEIVELNSCGALINMCFSLNDLETSQFENS